MKPYFSCAALRTPPLPLAPISAGRLSLLPNFQKRVGRLTGFQILEEVDGKERCDLYQGELQLLHKK